MKLRRVTLTNVRSFLEKQELIIDGDISIIIGPNGGGKTNLLDTVTTIIRRHILKSIAVQPNNTADQITTFNLQYNDLLNQGALERHTESPHSDQVIEIELEVTNRDIENMALIRKDAHIITGKTQNEYSGLSINNASKWDLSLVKANQRHIFTIRNNILEDNDNKAANIFREYLEIYEVDNLLRNKLDYEKPSTPFIFFPVNRASSGFQTRISLASFNEFESKRVIDGINSRYMVDIVNLAVGVLALKFRNLLEEDNGDAKNNFTSAPEIKMMTEILLDLGYKWEIKCTNTSNNTYDIELEKQGTKFLASQASSGEKELFTYVFSIFALNVRDALIIVDEPELHLHPQWQQTLLNLFVRLSKETGNQFLLTTHSPAFVSPSSIQYVSRIYSDSQKSKIVNLQSANTSLQPKHIFSIINSQNNEKMFFAEKVVLVEGISDRIFFEAVFNYLASKLDCEITYEIINVGGKHFFKHYATILNEFKVPYAIIADRDYLKQIGTPEIKSLFSQDKAGVITNVIESPVSKDRVSFFDELDSAIKSGNLVNLQTQWQYIKDRYYKIPTTLEEQEEALILKFIKSQYNSFVFLLRLGDLEDYLPTDCRKKNTDILIKYIQTDFWQTLPSHSQIEFEEIFENINKLN